jgi:molybdate transport system permease protein
MRTDRATAATITLLAAVFAVYFLLPFIGLIDRALDDGRTWDLAHSEQTRKALWLSIWTSTLTVALAIAFGTPVAYLLSRARFPGKPVVDALIDLPIVLPPTVAGVALLTAFGRRGLLGKPIEEWTGETFAFTTVAVIMAQLLVATPFYVRAARSGFDSVDRRLESVAYTLGASRTKTFFRIVLPQMRPAILAGIVLCWARSMGELGATLIFAGNFEGKTQTMPLAIIQAFETSSVGLAGAIALSLVLLAIATVLLVLFRVVTSRGAFQA